MKSGKLITATACFLMSTALVLAQTRGGGDSGGAPSRGGGGEHYRSESAPTPSSSSVGHTNTGSIGGGTNYSSPPPQQNYYGSPYYGNYWSSTQAFYYDLLRSYSFLPIHYYTFRYSVGDSAVDQTLVRLALRDSIETAHFLVSYSEELSGLLDQYQAGSMDREVFSDRFNKTLGTIQKLAKTIRKDSRLAYLDQRKGIETADPLEASSIAELRSLVDELRQQAVMIESGLEIHYQEDMSRVIDLKTLKQPSFKTLSSRIEKLSKAIKDSSKTI